MTLLAAVMTATLGLSSTAHPSLTPELAAHFAELALACVEREYPNKIAHVLSTDRDVQPPRSLTPVFYGCFDWHSAVHGHWLLVRLMRLYPSASFAPRAQAVLSKHLTPERVAGEVAYLRAESRAGFERPYGLAWLLQLGVELHEWNSPEARNFSAALQPLEFLAVERLANWLPKLTHPVRSGEHSQTAFALGLMLDWARAQRPVATAFATLLEERVRTYYIADRDCPLAYEPSGEDFLSPCLAEADIVRRVLPRDEYARWLKDFLPIESLRHLQPAKVSDRSDGKLVHLDGLNLSRAWMLDGIAAALSNGPLRDILRAAADAHREAGVTALRAQSYEGGHWLGSFATYLLTQRGLTNPR